jgi:hypothetical protein
VPADASAVGLEELREEALVEAGVRADEDASGDEVLEVETASR